MTEKSTPKTEPAKAGEAPAAVQVTLTEFCTRLSEKVRRVGLLAAFEYTERKAGRTKDTNEAFQGRFDKFVNTPV
jgi:hypothetical protein